jgi:serine/threonine protein kinase
VFYNFKCSACKNDIQAEYQYIGELVSCPICDSAQIVPDPSLPADSIFSGYKIIDVYTSTHLWTSYKAVGETELPGQEVLMRIPSSFYFKNDTNPEIFFNVILRNGSSNIEGFPALLDRSMTPGKIFFVYECNHKAKTLSGFASKVMPVRNSIQIVRNIAYCLNRAWEKEKLIHQNLKPSNVRLDDNGNVSILEFGLSQTLINNSHLLNKGFNIWDYRYMSPEFVLHGQASDPRCDIYSAGVILYFLLTGCHPYGDLTPQEVPNAEIPDPRKLNYEVPAPCLSLLKKMMEKDINARFQSWNEVISCINTSFPELLAVHQTASMPDNINISAMRTGRFEAFGQPAGEFPDEKTKTSKIKTLTLRKKKLTDTIARFSPDLVAGINRQWNPSISKPHETGKISPKVFLGLIAAAAVAIAIVSIFVLINIFKNQDAPQQQPVQDQAIIPKAVGQPSTASKSVKETPAGPEKTFKEICEFYEANPSANTAEAWKRLASLKNEANKRLNSFQTEAMKNNDINLTQAISDKQQEIELFEKQKVKAVIDKLRTETAALIKEGEHAKAFEMIEKYAGEFAAESANDRMALLLSLKAAVLEMKASTLKADIDSCVRMGNFEQADLIAGDFKGKTEQETLKERKALLADIAARKVKFIKDVTPLYNEAADNFLAGNNEPTIDKLKFFLNKPELPPEAESFAKNLHDNISSFKKLSQTALPLDGKIKECDSLFKSDSCSVLKGMLCIEEKSYDKARDFFKEVKCNMGDGFIKAASKREEESIRNATEREAESALTTILAKYEMPFNPEKPELFLFELTQKKNPAANAANLISALTQYNDKYKDTAFAKKHDNIIEAVRKFCKRAGVEDADKSGKIFTIQADTAQDGANQIMKCLSEKIDGISITLKPGEYRSEKLRELLFNQNGTKLLGEDGVIIKNNILITGKDILISGITLDGAWIACADNAKNITFKNCIFKSDLTKIMACSTVSFQNCLFKGLLIENSSSVSLNHCTVLAAPNAPEKAAALWIKGNSDIDVDNSIIYAEGYGIVFTNPDNSKDRKISNTLWYGEEGLCAVIVNNKIDEKGKVESDKKIKLPKYFKVKNNIHAPPQFVDEKKGVWRLVKGVPGTKKIEDGKDWGMNK